MRGGGLDGGKRGGRKGRGRALVVWVENQERVERGTRGGLQGYDGGRAGGGGAGALEGGGGGMRVDAFSAVELHSHATDGRYPTDGITHEISTR